MLQEDDFSSASWHNWEQ